MFSMLSPQSYLPALGSPICTSQGLHPGFRTCHVLSSCRRFSPEMASASADTQKTIMDSFATGPHSLYKIRIAKLCRVRTRKSSFCVYLCRLLPLDKLENHKSSLPRYRVSVSDTTMLNYH